MRTRDVAQRAGVNIATVHYYYASKEALIHAAYAQLQSRFQATVPADGSAAERLTTHLREVRALLLGDDALRSVLSEIALRARRERSEERRVGKECRSRGTPEQREKRDETSGVAVGTRG